VPQLPEPYPKGLEGVQRMRPGAGNFLPQLRQDDLSGRLLQPLQRPTLGNLRKFKMQGGTEDWEAEMYKMRQATEMVSHIAGIHKKFCG
jgi:hypothetical protein